MRYPFSAGVWIVQCRSDAPSQRYVYRTDASGPDAYSRYAPYLYSEPSSDLACGAATGGRHPLVIKVATGMIPSGFEWVRQCARAGVRAVYRLDRGANLGGFGVLPYVGEEPDATCR